MRDDYRSLLTTLSGFLGLWLILGFWPLSTGSQSALCGLVIITCASILWREWRVSQRHHGTAQGIIDTHLPPEGFQGALILTCGDTADLFGPGGQYRETSQGWYLRVNDPEQLLLLVQHLRLVRATLISQISILLAIVPEHQQSLDSLTQRLLAWKRAVVQCRSWLGGRPPTGVVTWVSPPDASLLEAPLWLSVMNTGIQVHLPGQGGLQLADWLTENEASWRFSRLSQALWFKSLLQWQCKTVDSLLKVHQGELPTLSLCFQGFCMTPVRGRADNLWQQHITSITALPPHRGGSGVLLPLPEIVLLGLPRRRGISQKMVLWRYLGLLTGVFLALAMLASFINNQRLIRSVGDHFALYHRLSGELAISKLQVQQRLRVDSLLLEEWRRRGEPLRYRLGLYQGWRLVAPVEAALSDWAPRVQIPLVTEAKVQGATTVRLDSLSLFDTGQSELKIMSANILVNALATIKARPGWRIAVSGHTDNSGTVQINQPLSLRRAEAVRNWIRDTGDIPERCFSVQGYGDSRPIASNDSPDGRARNRRVDISLIPQMDACL